MNRWLLGWGILIVMSPLGAADIEYHRAQKDSGRYTIELAIQADISEVYARSVLLAPDRVNHFSSAMQSIEHLASTQPGVKRFIDTTRICAVVFCVTYRNIMQLRLQPNQTIDLKVEPEGSDFRHGHVIWQTESLGKDTSRLSFHAVIEPAFWVPPAFGTVILKHRMTDVVYELIRRMECDYQGQTACDIYENDEAGDDFPF